MTRPASPRALALLGTVVLWASAFPAMRVGLAGLGLAALSFLRLAVAAVALLVVAPFAGVRRPATRRLVVGSAVALAGTAVVTLADGVSGFTPASCVVLAAALVQGIYHCATKPLLTRRTGLEVATYAMVAGTVFALPLAPATAHAVLHAPSRALGAALFLGLLPSALGFVLWGYAVARLPLAVSTAALYLVPPVALLVSFAWLGEVPHPVEVAGGAVTVAGVVHINRRRPAPRGRGAAGGRGWPGPQARPGGPGPVRPGPTRPAVRGRVSPWPPTSPQPTATAPPCRPARS